MGKRWHAWDKQPLFQVKTPDGHEYNIHSNGEVEGFPAGRDICNCIPMYRLEIIREYGHNSLGLVKLSRLLKEIFKRLRWMIRRSFNNKE
ncbi:MAG: hypothetical protein GY853_14065 [PVC group bacterium]|nr:hypothetical protein [PVC group bacterium]